MRFMNNLVALISILILASAHVLKPIARQIIKTNKAPAPIGPYSQAIRIGNVLYLTGQIAINPASGSMITGGIEAEALQTLKNIKAILESNGIGFRNVVKVTIMITDISRLAEVNKIYEEFFIKEVYPARSSYQVMALPDNALIMIDCIAYLKMM